MLTCSLALASWLLGTFPSSHCSPSRTSITVAVRKMALTWWVGRSISSYHMLGIVRSYSRQDWRLWVPGNGPFPKPARKIQIKILKEPIFTYKFCVGELCNKLCREGKYGCFSGVGTLNTKKEEQFSFVKWKEIFKESLTYTNIRLDLAPYRGLPWWLRW